ncbi:helix-turn-helix domain-containing protein (plasmid) [Roseobacteraceae bacterium NS-SX3]
MAKPTSERRVRGGSGPKLGGLIRKRRKQMGLTLQALCDTAGLSVGYLSQVERDHATPTLGTLAQIAAALEVGLEYFISTPKPADAVTRAGGRMKFSIAGSSVTYESLGADFPGSELSSYILHVPPGYASEEVSHEGEEIIYVLAGEIEQMLDGQSFRLRTGDSLHYSGLAPHSWSNPSAEPARLLWTGTLSVLHRKGASAALPELAADQKKTDNT